MKKRQRCSEEELEELSSDLRKMDENDSHRSRGSKKVDAEDRDGTPTIADIVRMTTVRIRGGMFAEELEDSEMLRTFREKVIAQYGYRMGMAHSLKAAEEVFGYFGVSVLYDYMARRTHGDKIRCMDCCEDEEEEEYEEESRLEDDEESEFFERLIKTCEDGAALNRYDLMYV